MIEGTPEAAPDGAVGGAPGGALGRDVVFRVDCRVAVDAGLLHALLCACALVLRRRLRPGAPGTFNVIVADRLEIAGRPDVLPHGNYRHASRTLLFALGTVLEPLDADEHEARLVLLGAHEATHAAQCAHADAAGLPVPETAYLKGPAYEEHPAEVDANEESLRVLAGLRPGHGGTRFPGRPGGYVMPDRSDYEAEWTAVLAGEASYRRVDLGAQAATAVDAKR